MTPDWQSVDGSVQLYCGDCLDILPHLPKVDAVVTDPPYGVELSETRTKHRKITAKYASVSDAPSDVLPVVIPAIKKCIDLARSVAVTPGTRLLQDYPKARDIGAIFFPNGAGVGRWGFICSHPILYYGRCPYLANGFGCRPNGVSATHWNRRKKPEHPCEKPLKMMEWIVNRASLNSEIVLDPFMGSGTTGVACINTGRKFIGIEIDKGYFEIAKTRIQMAIAEKSELLIA